MLIARGGIDAMLASPCAPATSSDEAARQAALSLLVCYRPLARLIVEAHAPLTVAETSPRKVARIIRRKARNYPRETVELVAIPGESTIHLQLTIG